MKPPMSPVDKAGSDPGGAVAGASRMEVASVTFSAATVFAAPIDAAHSQVRAVAAAWIAVASVMSEP